MTIASGGGVGISVRGLTKNFGPRPVFKNLALEIASGDFVSVLGPSGCGKSTLLRLIAGLETSFTGEISLQNRAEVSYVFQEAHLLPWRTALQNVRLPLEFRSIDDGESLARARAALARVRLSEAEGLYPSQLSGGMKMRVSLARALVTHPTLLLLDEPFAALDEINRYRLEEELRGIWAALGCTVIFVTHSITEAAYLSQRVVLLSRNALKVSADFRIELPAVRTSQLRTEPEFGRLVAALQRAFGETGA